MAPSASGRTTAHALHATTFLLTRRRAGAGMVFARGGAGRVSKKVVAWSACAVVLPLALGATFLSYYGGFLVMMLLTFIGAVLSAKPPAPRRPGPQPLSGRR